MDVHKDAPADERPTFIYQRLSGSRYDEISDLFDDIERTQDWTKEKEKEASKQRIDGMFTAAGLGLIDWRNQIDLDTGDSLPFAAADLRRAINPTEARELVVKRIAGAHLSADDKKKSD